MINKDIIEKLSREYDSYYLYDEGSIVERTGRLKKAFPDVDFLYSIKCNSHPEVVRSVFAQGFGADAASLGEVMIAAESGLDPAMILYSAPGKSASDIRAAWDKAVIIADSIGEIKLIEQIASGKGCRRDIGVRINPDFAFDGGAGMPSKFGIDEDQFIAFATSNACPHVRITGIHVHLKSQELCADVIGAYYRNIFELADRIEELTGTELEYIDLGSGIGVPYAESDNEPDIEKLSAALGAIRGSRNTRIIIEVGRYAVCKCGYYVTSVMDRKMSHGKTYVILKSTLNGFLRPSLAGLVERYAAEGEIKGDEPLYTGRGSFGFHTLKDGEGPLEKVDLVGDLCTAADVIAEDIMMPRLERGDIVIISNAGAYAAALSPMQFSSQERPAEIFVDTVGRIYSGVGATPSE